MKKNKGQIVDYYLRLPFKEYFEGLVDRKVLRRSQSDWRKPIRAIQKHDGGIELGSNLSAMNDLVKKDPYELPLIKDLIRATQGSVFITVID